MHEETFDGGLTLKLFPDNCPDSPRNWDNLGNMVCFHRRYNLGDEHNEDPREFRDRVEAGEFAIALPLYLYDHSGLRIKVGSWQGLLPGGHAEWDSGLVGWITVTKDKLRKEYSVKRVTKATLRRAEEVLRNEVETYDQYLSGDVWGFVIEDAARDHIDSCWGFYGWDYALEEARSAAKEHAQRKVEETEQDREKEVNG
jgi:hypothetical protein